MSSLGIFKRGPGPLVSFLLPTRGRPEQLRRAVASLYDTAESKDSLEVLIKLDTDDVSTLEAVKDLSLLYPGVQGIISPRGRGYFDLHLWLNSLANAARGDWLFVFTDDAVLKTQNWDRVLQSVGSIAPWPAIEDVCVLAPYVASHPDGCDFPVIRRGMYRLLGTMGPIPYVDAWFQCLATFVGALLRPPIEVAHEKPDSTPLHGADERPNFVRFCQPTTEVGWATVQAAARLLARIDVGYAAERWESRPPTAPGWYWWRKSDAAGKRFVAVLPGGGVSAPGGGAAEGLDSVFNAGGEWCPQL